jgi:hypothetical protein
VNILQAYGEFDQFKKFSNSLKASRSKTVSQSMTGKASAKEA